MRQGPAQPAEAALFALTAIINAVAPTEQATFPEARDGGAFNLKHLRVSAGNTRPGVFPRAAEAARRRGGKATFPNI